MARKIVNHNEVSFLRLGRKEVEVAIGSERTSAQPLLSWTVTARSDRRDILERN